MVRAIFDTHKGDSKLNPHSGQMVTVLRPLTRKEADLAETGPMFRVRFSDGFETDAFEDELRPLPVFTEYSLLVSHPDVLPYFTRAEFLFQKDYYEGVEFDDEMKAILALPLADFAERVKVRDLPDCFYDVKLASLMEAEKVRVYNILDGAFTAMGCVSDGDAAYQVAIVLDETKPVVTMPLSNQPTLCGRAYTPYHGLDSIKAELLGRLMVFGIELPRDFQICGYVGMLQGIKLD